MSVRIAVLLFLFSSFVAGIVRTTARAASRNPSYRPSMSRSTDRFTNTTARPATARTAKVMDLSPALCESLRRTSPLSRSGMEECSRRNT